MSRTQVGPNAFQNRDTSIRVLLADDSEIVRRGIRQLLSAQTEIEIVGECADFAQTIQMTSDLNPQLVILDLHMPDGNNIAPEDVRSHLNHGLLVLAISFWSDGETQQLAESFGATALLDKIGLAHSLIPTIMQLSRERRGCSKRQHAPGFRLLGRSSTQ
jgi:two-component system, NarL family, invasion response regulator UvrY